MDKQESQPKIPQATVPPSVPPTVPPTPSPVIPIIPKEKPETPPAPTQPAPQANAPQKPIPEKAPVQENINKNPPPKKESLLPTKLLLTSDSYYDPLRYRVRTDYEPEFGKAYEGIIPEESELRFLGNRRARCFYYMYGLEVCKHDILKKKGNTFLPCKVVMDAMWRCFTDNQYGTTIEEAPEYTKPWQTKFFDCFFHKSFGMEVCWPFFANMIRTIYRRPDSKLSKWY